MLVERIMTRIFLPASARSISFLWSQQESRGMITNVGASVNRSGRRYQPATDAEAVHCDGPSVDPRVSVDASADSCHVVNARAEGGLRLHDASRGGRSCWELSL